MRSLLISDNAKTLIFGDYLRSEEQDHTSYLQADECHDGGGEEAVHDTDHREGRKIPDRQIAHQFP